nr:hypothetical protein [Tanacetum cinerariifolium]
MKSTLKTRSPRVMSSIVAFCSCVLLSAIWFCVLLIEDISCVLPREDSAHFKTWFHFVSSLVAFCLKTSYILSQDLVAFCLKTCFVLSQDLLRFVSRLGCVLSQDFMRFVSRPPAFCLKTYCVLSQDLLHFVSRLLAFCLLLKTFLCILTFNVSVPIPDHLCLIGLTLLHGNNILDCFVEVKINRVNILKSIDEGPFQMGTVREPLAEGTEGAPHLGPERPRLYSDLSPEEKDRNIKMTMFRMQLNPKFVNNLLPEWGRFVTGVKLNRGLRDSSYDQLYAYLKHHKVHFNEKKMMLDRFTQHTMDPLALLSNVSHPHHYSPSSSTPPSTYVPPHLADNAHLDSGLSLTDNLIENLTNTLALLTQSYKKFIPQTNNQIRTSSNTRNQATVQDGRVVVQNVQGRQNKGQGTNPWGEGAVGYGGVQNRVTNTYPGQARQVKFYNCNGIGHIARNCTQPKCLQNSDYYKDNMLLMQAQENGVALNKKQLLFLAGGQDNAIDEDVDEQHVQDLSLNMDNMFQANDCDAFDSDVDEALTAQTMFMANLLSADPVNDEAGPSYDSDILSEVHDYDHYQDAICEHHEEHAMHDNVQLNHVVDSHADYTRIVI